MSKITAINKIIEFQRNLYYRAYYPDSELSIDEVSEMLDDIQKELEDEQSMKHIKFTIDITLPPDKEFLTKKDFMEAVYTCYGNIRDVNPNTIIQIN